MYSVSEVNGVKIYNMSAGKSMHQFEEQYTKTSKSLKTNQDFRRRIELVQDFQFEGSCSQVQLTEDQRYIICTGTYAPQLKIFDTGELSLKCLRGIESEAIKFCILSEDYSKIAIAETDRSIQFHAQYGTHFKTRIPHYPRDISFNPFNCNLLVSASANFVYRITLEEGKFLQPFETDSNINSLDYNRYLNVLFAGGEELEVWDFRDRRRATKLQAGAGEVSKVKSDDTGLLVAVGQRGVVDLFDVRFDRRMSRIKHAYVEPINSIEFDLETKHILSSTKKQIKITDYEGKLFTSIEPQSEINMFSRVKGSGLILSAQEDPKIGCFFIPELGPAPKWVPYLENVTEELEETQTKLVYDEYKFVTEQEIFDLECQNLVGSKLIKPYLHGYLMHLKLYNKLIADKPLFDFDEYRKGKIEEKLNEKVPERIEFKQKASDDRFNVGDNPDYVIDKYSEEYIMKHPNLKKQLTQEKQKIERLRKQKIERSLKIKKRREH